MVYEFECPFDVGDKVYVEVADSTMEVIDCPFCHGKNSIIHTGKMCEKHAFGFHRKSVEELVLECKTCNGTGIIKYRTPTIVRKVPAEVFGIHSLHGGGYEYIEFLLKTEAGVEFVAVGRDIKRYTDEENDNFD